MTGSQIDQYAIVYPLACYSLPNHLIVVYPIALLSPLSRSEGIASILQSSVLCKILLRDTGIKSLVLFYPLQSYQLYGSRQN